MEDTKRLLEVAEDAVPVKKTRVEEEEEFEDEDDPTAGRWTRAEDESLRLAVQHIGPRNWKRVASQFLHDKRTDVQCLHRWQKVLRPGLVKGPWTLEEDQTIVNCMKTGTVRWSEIAKKVPGRIGKQCRERWFNHLDPTIRRDEWAEDEDRKLVEGQALLGNKWSQIAKLYLPGRPENAVKNRWNAATRRRRAPHIGESTSLLADATRPTKLRGKKDTLRGMVSLASLCAVASEERGGKPAILNARAIAAVLSQNGFSKSRPDLAAIALNIETESNRELYSAETPVWNDAAVKQQVSSISPCVAKLEKANSDALSALQFLSNVSSKNQPVLANQ